MNESPSVADLLPPAVRQIAEAWPHLPPHIQDAILTLIGAGESSVAEKKRPAANQSLRPFAAMIRMTNERDGLANGEKEATRSD